MKIQAVLFDLDDTLVEASAAIEAAYNSVLTLNGKQKLLPGQMDDFAGVPADKNLLKLGFDQLQLPCLHQQYYEATAFHLGMVKRYQDTQFVLQKLKHMDVRIGVVTSREKLSAKQVLKNTKIDGYVDCLVGLGDTVEPKPSPAPFLYCSKWLIAKPAESLVVGDGAADMTAGKAGGFTTVWAKYGLGGSLKLPVEPDFTITRLNQLLELPLFSQ